MIYVSIACSIGTIILSVWSMVLSGRTRRRIAATRRHIEAMSIPHTSGANDD